jgi:hypothetical protein
MTSSSSGQALDFEYETVRISDVIVPKDHREADEETASRIADSIRAHGLLGPIVVRRQKAVGYFGEKKQTKPIAIDVNVDDDDDSELPKRLAEPDFADLD